jgi:Transposase IS66 family
MTQKELQTDYYNTKRMYEMQKETNANLKVKVQELREQNEILEWKLKESLETIEKLELEREKLKRMIFKGTSKGEWEIVVEKKKKSRERTKGSYQKATPRDEDITKRIHDVIDDCPVCGEKLRRKKHVTRYIENVVLPTEGSIPMRDIEKHVIDKWYCKNCKRWHQARSFHSQKVVIGEDTKIMIGYLTVIMRLSYHQTEAILMDLCGIKVSDGEISYIQKEHARKLMWYNEELKAKIRKQKGVHMDETSWKVQAEEKWNYWWIMKWSESTDVVYMLGKSRGKGNAEELIEGMNEESVGISDDYGAYKNLFKYHQLCWAHPYRKLRDLAKSWVLDKLRLEICMVVYKWFWELYEEAKAVSAEDFDIERRRLKKRELMAKFDELSRENENDPAKLASIKKSLWIISEYR